MLLNGWVELEWSFLLLNLLLRFHFVSFWRERHN
uniref:Uncharacterized protein n=1 Tax=Rhizophora mucronata TaxID=61149 RepID=A0A2P2PCS0_RHIMU